MTPSKVNKEARRWVAYADSDLKAARQLCNAGFYNQTCFLAQQAAEKALKAGLIAAQIDFPFVHNLDLLKQLLPEDWQTRQDVLDLSQLTSWTTAARYPTLDEEPTEVDAIAALKDAEAIVSLIQTDLKHLL